MAKRFDPIISGVPHILHGGDYNPEQWMKMKEKIITSKNSLKFINLFQGKK